MGWSCAGHSTHGTSCKCAIPWIAADAPELTRNLQSGSVYCVVRYALNRLDLENDKESIARKSAAAAVLRRLDPHEADTKDEHGGQRRSRKEDLVLNQYEQMVAMDVVAPEDIPVAFDGIVVSS